MCRPRSFPNFFQRHQNQPVPGASSSEDAAKLGALLLLVPILLDLTPGRVRMGIMVGRHGRFRRVRRGHVIVVVVLFGLSLTPLTCVRPAHAGGGGGTPPGPSFPVYFVHTDHLGSTTMLTCYKRPTAENCPDGAVAEYFRYDAYGTTKAYKADGSAVTSGQELTKLLYTGQRFESDSSLYYYGARFYDPRIARFVTEDPVREYMNPYAYVAWNPVKFTDPTGMFGLVGLSIALALNAGPNGPAGPPNPEQILKRDFAVTLLMRGLGKGHGGEVGGVALTSINAALKGGSKVGFIVAGLALLSGQQFTVGGVTVSLNSSGVGQAITNALASFMGSSFVPSAATVPENFPDPGVAHPSAQDTATGLTGTAAGAAIFTTGGIFLRGALGGAGHIGPNAAQIMNTAGPGGGLLAVISGLSDAALMAELGLGFALVGAFTAGAFINDYAIAPSFGTPTEVQAVQYIGGQIGGQ